MQGGHLQRHAHSRTRRPCLACLAWPQSFHPLLLPPCCRVTTSSGALTLDLALGGGYPKGRVVEIYGPGAMTATCFG